MRSNLDTEPLLEVSEVARRLNVEEHLAYRLVQQGLLSAVQLGGYRRGVIRISTASLDRALRAWEVRGRG